MGRGWGGGRYRITECLPPSIGGQRDPHSVGSREPWKVLKQECYNPSYVEEEMAAGGWLDCREPGAGRTSEEASPVAQTREGNPEQTGGRSPAGLEGPPTVPPAFVPHPVFCPIL